MSEADTIESAAHPLTVESLATQFAACGLAAGQTVIVHTRISALGWISGGPVAIIQALLRVLSPTGTLMMPAFSSGNTEPSTWSNPPVDENWWQTIRESMPAYDARITPTRGIGITPELFRTYPGVLRGEHPTLSFAAIGPNAQYLVENHTSLTRPLDDSSPLGKLYELDGHVFLLGPDHGNNTSLHLAEYRANIRRNIKQEGSAMFVDGVRRWVEYEMEDVDESDFAELGDAYEATYNIRRGRVGKAEVRLMKQRPLVDFAVHWLEQNRTS